jgi:hypothetical protein
MDMVKLLPGEKMIYKDKNTTVVLDSHTQQQRFGSSYGSGMFNPPKLDSAYSNNKILNSYKKKHSSNNINGMQQFPQFINPGQMNNMPNSMMMNMMNNNGMNMNNMGMNYNNMNGMENIGMNQMGNMNGMGNIENYMGGNSNSNNNDNNVNENFVVNNNNQNRVQLPQVNHQNTPNLAPNFKFKQMTGNESNTQGTIQKDFYEMKNQFSKMMVYIILNNKGKFKRKREQDSNAGSAIKTINV